MRVNKLIIVSLLLFLVLLPLSLRINYIQNDEWAYYPMVQDFMQGDFNLDPQSAPTFYLQGILGAVFSVVFGISSLPVLTLLVSCAACYVFMRILNDHLKLDLLTVLLVSSIFFFNPLNVYATFGFMTENYFVLFLLPSFYFAFAFEKSPGKKYFVLVNLFIVLAFLVRQVAFAISLAFAASLLISRRYKYFIIQVLLLAGLYAFYVYIFPRTPEMFDKPLQPEHVEDWSFMFSTAYAIALYLAAFGLPLIFVLFKKSLSGKLPMAILLITLSAACYFAAIRQFIPKKLVWAEFPYLSNTWERTGFYPRGILGTKYQFKGNYDLYKYWDLAAKVAVSTLLPALIIIAVSNAKSRWVFKGVSFAYVLIYAGAMLFTLKVYDRYLTALLPIFLILLMQIIGKLDTAGKVATGVFAFFLAFYSVQLSVDYILVNRYVWARSEELVNTTGLSRRYIQGDNAWKMLFPNPAKSYLYDFSYDSPKNREDNRVNYKLLETKDLTFFGSIFVNPKIYLYQKL